MRDTTSPLGAQLRNARKGERYSLRTLGKQVGLGKDVLGRFERGEKDPGDIAVGKLLAIESVLGFSADDYLEHLRQEGAAS